MASHPPRLLLIDGDASARRLLGKLLAHSGFEITGASNAEEAFGSLAAGKFDVILLDLSVKGQDGGDIIGQLRIMAPKTPYVVMSLPSPGDAAFSTVLEGATAYVTKPTEAADLHWLLARATGRFPAVSGRSGFLNGPSGISLRV